MSSQHIGYKNLTCLLFQIFYIADGNTDRPVTISTISTKRKESAVTEKETFLQNWEREFQITLKVFKAFPADKIGFKPAERSRPAGELMWVVAGEETIFINAIISGQFDFQNIPKPPATYPEMLTAYENIHSEMVNKAKNFSDADFNKILKFMVGPNQMADFRAIDLLWIMLMDQIHHRGQFSVYLRMAGGKVPAIYGPSADEPWL
jgi:uncharacterized damage-inducible protein DinB